jgi:hypothetical protein
MSAILGKAGKKIFERNLEQYAPPDPLYEFYIDDRGKKQRRKVTILPLKRSPNPHHTNTPACPPTRSFLPRCQDSQISTTPRALPRQGLPNPLFPVRLDLCHRSHPCPRRRRRSVPKLSPSRAKGTSS